MAPTGTPTTSPSRSLPLRRWFAPPIAITITPTAIPLIVYPSFTILLDSKKIKDLFANFFGELAMEIDGVKRTARGLGRLGDHHAGGRNRLLADCMAGSQVPRDAGKGNTRSAGQPAGTAPPRYLGAPEPVPGLQPGQWRPEARTRSFRWFALRDFLRVALSPSPGEQQLINGNDQGVVDFMQLEQGW